MLSSRKLWSIAVLLIAAGVSLWAARWLVGDRRSPLPLPTARSDYVLENFDLLIMNAEGIPRFRVESPYLEKNPADESVSLDQPHMWLFEAGNLSWEARAANGWIRADGEEILLTGEVELQEQAGGDMRVETSQLTLYPEVHLAHSSAAVDLRQNGVWMDGVGLDADLSARRFEILSKVKGRYDPN